MTVYYTYILRSLKDGCLYVGSTADVDRRLHRHNEGMVCSTRNRRPLELLYRQPHATRSEAVQREMYLKSLAGSAEKRRLAEEALRQRGNS